MLRPATLKPSQGSCAAGRGDGDCRMPRGEAMLRELVSRGVAGPWTSQLELAAGLIGQLAAAAKRPNLYAACVTPDSRRNQRQSLQLWLMGAEGTLSPVAASLHSLLLMSGTLAPLVTTVSELGQTFGSRVLPPLAVGHVVGRQALKLLSVSQAASSASTKLECTFRAWKRRPFLQSVGQALLTVVRAIPAGVLVFLPSFDILDRCLEEWQQRSGESIEVDINAEGGCTSRRGGRARGGSARGAKRRCRGAVERVPEYGQGSVEAGSGSVSIYDQLQEAKGTIVVEPAPPCTEVSSLSAARTYKIAKQHYEDAIRRDGRGLLLAVYRGRMSEGVSFDDNFARGVVCIGIPFPNLTEERLAQKRATNDFWVARGLSQVSGDAWYETKALHAVAQALGRCIRHPKDFGALVLLDSRWAELGKASSLPHWLQPFLEDKPDAPSAAQSLQTHFKALVDHRLWTPSVPSMHSMPPTQVKTEKEEKIEAEMELKEEAKLGVKMEMNEKLKEPLQTDSKIKLKVGATKEVKRELEKESSLEGLGAPKPRSGFTFKKLVASKSASTSCIDLE
eukprot:TRINITY_DN3162_c0_g1_i5.p1 TRINITY_DN3162_c0_g1~~TRINITY_DN3162_c0_g1_i5.p1  ORF type:complete len:564 (+),score=122.38 TRINITY_DN3162_c0_g1_i5:609-2300(+)